MIRRGWLEHGPGPDRQRGRDEFVAVSWPRALDLAAGGIASGLRASMGRAAMFGGSYGWASAGRFHDAQHQLHRFLNLAGGYVRSVNSYSSGAATVILPHIVGSQGIVAGNNVSWDELVAESALVLAFGGMALKNNDVGGGGSSQHIARDRLRAARERGVEFHLIGPLRDDLPAEVECGVALDPPWNRCRADARPRAHAGNRRAGTTAAFSTAIASAGSEFEAYLLGHGRRAAKGCRSGPPISAACRRKRSSALARRAAGGAP